MSLFLFCWGLQCLLCMFTVLATSPWYGARWRDCEHARNVFHSRGKRLNHGIRRCQSLLALLMAEKLIPSDQTWFGIDMRGKISRLAAKPTLDY